MSKKILSIIILSIALLSCESKKDRRPATALDTGRNFIRATLDGDFTSAEGLLLNDSQNVQLFDSYKVFYRRLPAQSRLSYKNASYNINSYTDLNDSVSLINYSNSYMNKPLNIKLARKDKIWYVDFKYTSSDSTEIK